jgi:hypothetical protein
MDYNTAAAWIAAASEAGLAGGQFILSYLYECGLWII